MSGCIPLDPKKGQVVAGGVEAQTEQALSNLKAVVEAGGSSVGQVIKTTVNGLPLSSFALSFSSTFREGFPEIDERFRDCQRNLREVLRESQASEIGR